MALTPREKSATKGSYLMCGLVCVLNFDLKGLWGKDVGIFRELMIASALRGMDGAGVMYAGDKDSGLVDKGNYAGWFKRAGTSAELFNGSKVWREYEKDVANSRFLAGHCRAATRGDIGSKNAHPFEVENITLMHNGTLNGLDSYKEFKDHDCDSEALTYAMAEDKDPAKTLSGLDGAAAVIWYDSEDSTWNMWKNWQRPLFIVKAGYTFYMASEDKLLEWVLTRNNANYIGNINPFPANTWFKWKHDDIEPEVTKLERIYPKRPSNNDAVAMVALPRTTSNTTIEQPVQRGLGVPESWFGSMIDDLEDQIEEEELIKKLEAEGIEVCAIPAAKTNKRKEIIPVKNFFGLTKDKEISWMPMNIEYLGDNAEIAIITGQIYTFINSNDAKDAVGMLDDVKITAYIRGKTTDEIIALYKTDLLKGTVQSIVLSVKDVNDAKCYLSGVEPYTEPSVEHACSY
jgi:hypothetical protein